MPQQTTFRRLSLAALLLLAPCYCGDTIVGPTAPPDTVVGPGDPAGSQPHAAGVDLFRGTYAPRIPLDVLPARGGLTPDLGLVYSPTRINGFGGAGWGLAFESAITRRSLSGGVPSFEDFTTDPDDSQYRYEADGVRLVPSPDGDGTYRTLRDAFTVYEPLSAVLGVDRLDAMVSESLSAVAGVDRIDAWRVRSPGATRTYGSVALGRPGDRTTCPEGVDPGPDDCAHPVRWRITSVEDDLGNRIDIEYEADTWNAETTALLRPSRILYNRGTHIVDFFYEERPDVRVARADGTERVVATLLSRIDVRAVRDSSSHVSHRFQLTYRQAVADGQSLLEKVDRVAVDPTDGTEGESTLVRRLEYADVPRADFRSADAPRADAPRADALGADALGADVHRVDISPADSRGWADWSQITVVGPTLRPDYYEFTEAGDGERAYSSVSQLFDVDRDALPDLVQLNSECWTKSSPRDPTEEDLDDASEDALAGLTYRDCAPAHRVFLNQPQAAGGPPRFLFDDDRSLQLDERLGAVGANLGGLADAKHLFVDLDGDGWTDLVRGPGGSEVDDDFLDKVFLGSASGWADGHEALWTDELGGLDPFEQLRLADIDADGKVDLVGEEVWFRNSGSPPFFDENRQAPIAVRDGDGNPIGPPADQPESADGDCMSPDHDGAVVEADLGRSSSSHGSGYLGLEQASEVSVTDWV